MIEFKLKKYRCYVKCIVFQPLGSISRVRVRLRLSRFGVRKVSEGGRCRRGQETGISRRQRPTKPGCSLRPQEGMIG